MKFIINTIFLIFRTGHTCNYQWIVMSFIAWDGLDRLMADKTYDLMSTKLATHGKPDQRQCETNKQKTCGCQGLQSSIGICIILTISFTKFRQI